MPDRDGYPTEEELDKLRNWQPLEWKSCRPWLSYARSLWWAADWGWPDFPDDNRPFVISTGGWSGNESIIEAMQEAHFGILWHHVWEMTRKGGHYLLSVAPAPEPCKDVHRVVNGVCENCGQPFDIK